MDYTIGDLNAAVTVSDKGGKVIAYRWEGFDIIYPKKIVYGGNQKERYGIPICFPIFGPPPEKFAKEISQHGWLRDQYLNLVSKSDRSLTLMGVNKRKRAYRWLLRYQVTITVGAMGELEVKFQTERLHDGIEDDLPINVAFHPYFKNENPGERAVTVGEKVMTDINEKALIIPAEERMIIDLGRRKVEMFLGGDFESDPHVALWSDSDKYFCVEPILTHPDDFDTPKGRYLGQGEKITLICTINPS